MTSLAADPIEELWQEIVADSGLSIVDVLALATEDELAELDRLLVQAVAGRSLTLLPHQIPPLSAWDLWILLGGRGTGKTQACADYMWKHVQGPPCDPRMPGGHRMAIIGPTQGDAIDSCYRGPSGLRAIAPGVKLRGGEFKAVEFPNGSQARVFGTDTEKAVDRLRAGGNNCLAWLEEFAAWPRLQEGLDQMRFGLRLGPHPRAVGSSTPKNRPEIKALLAESKEPRARTVISHGETDDNPHLPATTRIELYRRYSGTRLGGQELKGLVLDDIGDIFKASWFKVVDRSPVPENTDGTAWRRVRFWDMAATEGPEIRDALELQRLGPEANKPDWTAGALVAYNRETGHLVIEHIASCRRSPGRTQEFVLAIAERDGHGIPVRMEEEPGASGVSSIDTYRTLLRGWAFDGIRPSGSKFVRAGGWAGLAEKGLVSVVAGPWVAGFVDEAEEFTEDETHAHDDQIDAVSGGYMVLVRPNRRGGLRA